MQVFGHGVQLVAKGEVEPRDTKGEGRKELEDGSKVPAVSWYYCFFGARNRTTEAEVEQRGNNPVLVMHDGVTKSIFAHLIPAKRVDFPSCEKVVKMIAKGLDTLDYHRVVLRCDNEPFWITTEWCFDVTMSPPFLRYSGR